MIAQNQINEYFSSKINRLEGKMLNTIMIKILHEALNAPFSPRLATTPWHFASFMCGY
jgi:hypothetical protein